MIYLLYLVSTSMRTYSLECRQNHRNGDGIMFLNIMICTQGFLYRILDILKTTNILVPSPSSSCMLQFTVITFTDLEYHLPRPRYCKVWQIKKQPFMGMVVEESGRGTTRKERLQAADTTGLSDCTTLHLTIGFPFLCKHRRFCGGERGCFFPFLSPPTFSFLTTAITSELNTCKQMFPCFVDHLSVAQIPCSHRLAYAIYFHNCRSDIFLRISTINFLINGRLMKFSCLFQKCQERFYIQFIIKNVAI